MQTPRSSRYAFIELVSEHPQFQAWRAKNISSGELCFVKYTPGTSSIVGSDLVAMQMAGVRLQHRIRSARVAKARSCHLEGKDLYVEYPFLDLQRWGRLTHELFWTAPERLLTEMCLTIDYLHQLGLVHGDIKLDNFLLSCRPELELKLIDLDFISQEYTRPKAKLFGTPGYIAPEIEGNNIVAPQSDNFSLGISLRKALDWLHEQEGLMPDHTDWAQRLSQLAEVLTHPDYLQRPFELLAACRRYDLVDETSYNSAMRRLFAAYMLSELSWPGYFRSRPSQQLGNELRGKHRVFGVHTDLLTIIQEGIKRNASGTFQAVKKLVASSVVERQEKFFYLNISDADALTLLDQCQIPGESITALAVRTDGITGCLELAKSLVHRQMPYVAYLFLKQIMDREGSRDQDSLEAIPRYRYFAELADRLNRVGEVWACYERVVQIQKAHGDMRLDAVVDAVTAALRIDRIDDACALIQEARVSAQGPEHDRLNLLRKEGWIQHLRGNYRQAEETLRQVVDQADQLELTDIRIVTRYGLAVVAWRQADSKRAVALLITAYRLSISLNCSSELVLILSMLALLYSQAGRYQKSIRAAKAAIHAATPDQARLLYFVYDTLIGSYVRIAKFEKARYWLQEYMSNRQAEGGSDQLLAYSLNVGHVEMEASRLREAVAVLGPLSTYPAVAGRWARGKVHQSLAMIELRKGRIDQCLHHISQARTAQAGRKDASLKELDLLEIMASLPHPSAAQTQQLLTLAAQLQKLNSCHYACLAVYWAMLASPQEAAQGIPSELRQLVSHRESREVPLFSAIRSVLECYDAPDPLPQRSIACWKSAFLILLRGRQIHLALETATWLRQTYLRDNHPRHARKYALHARSLAKSLENDSVRDQLDREIALEGSGSIDHRRLVESYLSISELLREIGDYQQAMRRVLAFAVEQTGAERGILFLKRGDREEFQIGAAVNCDEQSIEELSDFSSHLPWLSAQEEVPLLIDNAVQDRRTNKYQSVIEHNILSVACVPLRDHQELRGVLYLDHHLIPSLFEPDDIRYLLSLANFLTLILMTASNLRAITLKNAQLRDELSRLGTPSSMITEDPVMLAMVEKLPQIAQTSASVLLQGESGTGKEILADMIHRCSLRAAEPLIKLNCATLSPNLLESELFGIAKNVATGVGERDGKFAAADGGTLFLDEIGDMPLDIQAKVLRAIENQQFEKVGSNRPIRTDIRFLYATNKNLGELVAQNKFRQDLYFRINTIVLELPPLRQRRNDIPLLLNHFLALFAQAVTRPRFSPDALDALMQYKWPGNVRQLRNLVENCVILYPAALIQRAMLPREILNDLDASCSSLTPKETAEKAAIEAAWEKSGHDVHQAARILGISISTLRRRLKKYGLGNR